MNHKFLNFFLSVGLCFCVSTGLAEKDLSEVRSDDEVVVVVGHKTPQPLKDVVGVVYQIDDKLLSTDMIHTSERLFDRYPGISTEKNGSRFATSGFNIRGIGGNRVATEIDGQPVRRQFGLGSYSYNGRDMLETGLVESIEVLSGPSSTLYGSSAIGGIVDIRTWTPFSLTRVREKDLVLDGRLAYDGANRGKHATTMMARRTVDSGVMVAGTIRRGRESDVAGNTSVPTDLSDWQSSSGMFKFQKLLDPGQLITLGFTRTEKDNRTRLRALPGYGRFRNTTDLTGNDRDKVSHLFASYELDERAAFDTIEASAHYQDSSVRQATRENRTRDGVSTLIQREFRFAELGVGLEINGFRALSSGQFFHKIGIGVELQQSITTEFRDGMQTDLDTGESSKIVLGEELPVRDFPRTRTQAIGLFVFDELSFASLPLKFVPGVRFEKTRIEPISDELFALDNPEYVPAKAGDHGFSPKLGLIFQPDDQFEIFAQYVSGFRAPPAEDVNFALSLPGINARALPNPDLRSESSDGLELGFRWRTSGTQISAAAFYTHYDDFINSRELIHFEPSTGEAIFQSRNIERARISGIEFSLRQQLAALNPMLSGFDFEVNAFWAESKNKETGWGLASVMPPGLTARIDWAGANDDLAVSLQLTLVDRKDDLQPMEPALFRTPGYATLDLNGRWEINNSVTLVAGIYNLTDKRYWRHSKVRNLRDDDPQAEIRAEPGTNAAISINLEF